MALNASPGTTVPRRSGRPCGCCRPRSSPCGIVLDRREDGRPFRAGPARSRSRCTVRSTDLERLLRAGCNHHRAQKFARPPRETARRSVSAALMSGGSRVDVRRLRRRMRGGAARERNGDATAAGGRSGKERVEAIGSTCRAVARASAAQSGMPTPRRPLPVKNRQARRASARWIAAIPARCPTCPARSRAETDRCATAAGRREGRAAIRARRAHAMSARRPIARGRAGSRVPPTNMRGAAPGPPAPDPATSTTATTRQGCRAASMRGTTNPDRSTDGRRRSAGTRAPRCRPSQGISPTGARSPHRRCAASTLSCAGAATMTARTRIGGPVAV